MVMENGAQPTQPVSTRAFADYEWCIRSPAMIREAGPGVNCPTDAVWAEQPAPFPNILPKPPDPHHFRLGHHFEALVGAWTQVSPSLTPVANNLQVFAGKRTVGEFDLLVEQSGRVEHWELAVKFYLAADHPDDPTRWFGPNTADRFDLKFARMRDHQLQLSRHPRAIETLAVLGIRAPNVTAMVKGRLFHDFQRYIDAAWVYPDSVNPGHCRGWWLEQRHLARLLELGESFVWLPKSLWLAPIAAGDSVVTLDLSDLRDCVAAAKTKPAEQFAVLDENGNETSRGFIVSPSWISRTRRSDKPGA